MYFKSDVFRRYISKNILLVREINWITPVATKPFFCLKIITLKPFPQLKGLNYICINLIMLVSFNCIYFWEKATKQIRVESTLKQRKIMSYLKLIDFWRKISSNVFSSSFLLLYSLDSSKDFALSFKKINGLFSI